MKAQLRDAEFSNPNEHFTKVIPIDSVFLPWYSFSSKVPSLIFFEGFERWQSRSYNESLIK